MNSTNLEIIKQNNSFFLTCDQLDFCIECKTEQEAKQLKEEFLLNYALYCMYLKDDEKELHKYCQNHPELGNEDELRGKIFAMREININSKQKTVVNGKTYTLITSMENISLKRENKELKYLSLNKIKDTLKAILSAKSKWQNGLDITNLNWDKNLVSNIFYYLYKDELTPKISPEEKQLIQNYTGFKYATINNLLCGEIIPANALDHELIDTIIIMRKCMVPTPFDLYLHRGTGSKHYLKNSEMVYQQFISTSIDYQSISPFRHKDVHDFYIPKGSLVFFNSFLNGENSVENEIILPPTKFSIKEKKQNNDDETIYKLYNGEEIDIGQLIIKGIEANKENYLLTHSIDEYQELIDYAMQKITELTNYFLNSKNEKDKKQKLLSLKDIYSYYKNIKKFDLNVEKNLDTLSK